MSGRISLGMLLLAAVSVQSPAACDRPLSRIAFGSCAHEARPQPICEAVIAQKPELKARNVHFEDHMEDGQMVFDYRMREGTVSKSNAIALMRAVGLEV